jgi:hypothetical protein
MNGRVGLHPISKPDIYIIFEEVATEKRGP